MIPGQDTGSQDAYWRFHDAVAQAQIGAWIAQLAQGGFLVDISDPASRCAALAAGAGHTVLRVADAAADGGESPGSWVPPGEFEAGSPVSGEPAPGGTGGSAARQAGPAVSAGPAPGGSGGRAVPPGGGPKGGGAHLGKQSPGRLRTVAADGSGLEFLADGCADGVIAEDRTLSRRLAAETLVSEIWRVLRPAGRVLASVDSLTLGMAVLAGQHHWPHLVDVPHADVVLIPWPDGTITRCYGAQQLRELFAAGGFEVDWIRPRTAISASTVSYLLARDPGSFPRLVQAELQASADDSVGAQLVISARKQ